MGSYAIGVDIGGTKIAIGMVDKQGQVKEKQVLQTNIDKSPYQVCEQIYQVAAEIIQQSGVSAGEIAGLGIGAPGPIDRVNGTIVCPPNLPKWNGFPIRKFFAERVQIPVLFENDANVATLAEKWVGAAQENENFIYLTISTGVGGGLFFNGDVVWGKRGNAGEVGFTTMTPDGQTIEELASGTAIAKRASALMNKQLTTQEVFQLYALGDSVIVPLIEETFQYLGRFCTNLIHFCEPEKIVIGGGVSQVGEPLFNAVRHVVRQHASSQFGRETEIVPAGLQQDTGLIGASALFLADVRGSKLKEN
ncbi:ROK family protein [Paenactinomyces guangxiensis]|uniref:ROK family protein n=1 Tax=Paenactinomyces guangxiensis TaxID=1490290 RepID=A0A7W2A8V5_9BACL|nr:ROK family protein [Paenactinomyces guangxiensis]MBA4494567.1 ROK family protein [Paenactinomyces guangxiensis]MBH8591670.1 ROK family protein [Paenactinomyces guangxiensis]